MKRLMISMLAGAMSLAAFQAIAADKVTLQLKWVTQSQFAGYYVAKDKGFYEEEGLDVDIKPGGPDIAPEQVIAGGGADVIVDWMGGALAAREKGVPLVNIAQPFKKAGMELVCPKDGPVKTEADFKGHTLGVWFFGNEYPFFAWMNKLGLSTEGGADGVTVLKQSFDVQPLIQKQADCISVMTYNEYWQLIDAGYKPEDLIVFNYSAMGNDLLEDGLYALEDKLKDPAFEDKMVRFVRASMKGWKYAVDNSDEAAGIVVENGGQDENHQKRMMGEIAKLIDNADGKLVEAAYERTAKALLDQKIITKEPTGAWTVGDHRQGDQVAGAGMSERRRGGRPPLSFGRWSSVAGSRYERDSSAVAACRSMSVCRPEKVDGASLVIASAGRGYASAKAAMKALALLRIDRGDRAGGRLEMVGRAGRRRSGACCVPAGRPGSARYSRRRPAPNPGTVDCREGLRDLPAGHSASSRGSTKPARSADRDGRRDRRAGHAAERRQADADARTQPAGGNESKRARDCPDGEMPSR